MTTFFLLFLTAVYIVPVGIFPWEIWWKASCDKVKGVKREERFSIGNFPVILIVYLIEVSRGGHLGISVLK